jgi:hypothetical protein
MDQDNNKAAKSDRGIRPWEFVVWPFAVLIFYVLSLGPVDWLFGGGSPVVRFVYAPLMWVYRHAEPFRIVFDKYMELWDKNW